MNILIVVAIIFISIGLGYNEIAGAIMLLIALWAFILMLKPIDNSKPVYPKKETSKPSEKKTSNLESLKLYSSIEANVDEYKKNIWICGQPTGTFTSLTGFEQPTYLLVLANAKTKDIDFFSIQIDTMNFDVRPGSIYAKTMPKGSVSKHTYDLYPDVYDSEGRVLTCFTVGQDIRWSDTRYAKYVKDKGYRIPIRPTTIKKELRIILPRINLLRYIASDLEFRLYGESGAAEDFHIDKEYLVDTLIEVYEYLYEETYTKEKLITQITEELSQELKNMTVKELKKLADDSNIKLSGKDTKSVIVDKILSQEKTNTVMN